MAEVRKILMKVVLLAVDLLLHCLEVLRQISLPGKKKERQPSYQCFSALYRYYRKSWSVWTPLLPDVRNLATEVCTNRFNAGSRAFIGTHLFWNQYSPGKFTRARALSWTGTCKKANSGNPYNTTTHKPGQTSQCVVSTYSKTWVSIRFSTHHYRKAVPGTPEYAHLEVFTCHQNFLLLTPRNVASHSYFLQLKFDPLWILHLCGPAIVRAPCICLITLWMVF